MESGPIPVAARKRPSRSGSAAMKPSAAIASSSAAACGCPWSLVRSADLIRFLIRFVIRFLGRLVTGISARSTRPGYRKPPLARPNQGHPSSPSGTKSTLDAMARCRLGRCPKPTRETEMHKGRISVAGMSVLFALGLAAWEVYFFWFAGSFKHLDGTIGFFTADRLGFNMAWLAAIYLTYQLLSIPFSLPSAATRFLGVVDGMASLVPLAVVLI